MPKWGNWTHSGVIVNAFLATCFLILFPLVSWSQISPSSYRDWDSLNNAYLSRKIPDTTYLNTASALAMNYERNPNLKDMLDIYWHIAFNDQRLAKYRVKYFALLAHNALRNNNTGAEIFYIEKEEEELRKKPGYIPTLNPATIQIAMLSDLNKGVLGLEKCKQVNGFIDSLPTRIHSENISFTIIYNAQNILKYKQGFYQELSDTANAASQIERSKNLFNEVSKTIGRYSSEQMTILRKDILFMEFQKYQFLKKEDSAERSISLLIREMENAKLLGYSWAPYETLGFYTYFISYYMDMKKVDSASKYAEMYRQQSGGNSNVNSVDQYYWEQESKLQKGKANYHVAYDYLSKAYLLQDSITKNIMFDVSNNLYAQAESEYNKKVLDQAIQEKRRNIFISIIIFLLFGSTIMVMYVLYRRNRKKALRNIEMLKAASRREIEELEGLLEVTRLEEQQRLGMELHDDLGGTIAFLKIRMETEMLQATDPVMKNKLTELSELLTEAYRRARDKSHALYSVSKDREGASFKERIVGFLNKGLEGKNYQTELYIDDEVILHIPLRTKIEMVYIIQEAVTNIIKHSGAKKFSILIYKDVQGLILKIEDDGKGFDKRARKGGIGLNSIKARVFSLNGNLEIDSSSKGTSITVTIPDQEL